MNSYKVPQSTRPRKTKTFDRVVGQAVALVIPDSYREMVARLSAPQPTVALTVRLIGEQVKSIKLAGERDAREAKGRMTLEHPFMVKMLAGYTRIDRYELRSEPGVIVESYVVKAEEPVIIQTAPTQALVIAEEEPAIKPVSPATDVALSLKAEYPELAKRIDAALEAVEAGLQPSYKTEWDNAGRYGTWSCDCPDAKNRNPRTRFGVACKHALAGVIRQQVEQREADTRNREVEKQQDRRQRDSLSVSLARETALPAAAQAGSILDWLDDEPQPATRKSGADLVREIEAENAERYAREHARYASAARPDPRNMEGRPSMTRKGIGHL